MRIIAIIQARMESTRLPGKVLIDLCGKSVLEHIVTRARKSKYINEVVVATSTNNADDAIEEFTKANNIQYYRGSQENVLERFYKCAKQYNPDIIVRLTGDNTLIDYQIIDEGIEYFIEKKNSDYIYYREGLPVGVAVEIFRFSALERAFMEADDSECLEHVTPYIYRNPEKFNSERVKVKGEDYSSLRWTLDTESDFELVSEIYNAVYLQNPQFSFYDILEEYKKHPEWIEINSKIEQVKVKYEGEKRKL